MCSCREKSRLVDSFDTDRTAARKSRGVERHLFDHSRSVSLIGRSFLLQMESHPGQKIFFELFLIFRATFQLHSCTTALAIVERLLKFVSRQLGFALWRSILDVSGHCSVISRFEEYVPWTEKMLLIFLVFLSYFPSGLDHY
jgi:hypothetical protein